jgi:PIN domain nuclease of toxin-antitoxin system
MRILLDTHFLLWSFTDTTKIKKQTLELLLSPENEVYYSQASLWEIAIKFNIGKLEIDGLTPEGLYEEIDAGFYLCLNLENEDLISFHRLAVEHRDPFDRIMIWQSIRKDIHFLSSDSKTEAYRKHGLKLI